MVAQRIAKNLVSSSTCGIVYHPGQIVPYIKFENKTIVDFVIRPDQTIDTE